MPQVYLDFEPFRRHLYKEIKGYPESNMSEADINTYIVDLEMESYENIKRNILPEIEAALARIPWRGSKVWASCDANYDSYFKSYDLDALDGTSLYLLIGDTGKAGLLVYKNEQGKVEVDDIIETGDEEEEFFDNGSIKADYYALVQSLQQGDTSNQILTLYTARPKKDRSLYLHATTLPANIFLTNSYSHAEGLARDLVIGDEEPRDVYKVRMKNQNLIKTLNGNISYYQLVRKTPIQSIRLI